MRQIVNNESGRLFTGLFFAVETVPTEKWRNIPGAWTSRPGPVVTDYLYSPYSQARKHEVSQSCSIHPEIELRSYEIQITVALHGSSHGGGIVSFWEGDLIVEDRIRRAMQAAGLTSLRFIDVQIGETSYIESVPRLSKVCIDGPFIGRDLQTIPTPNAVCVGCGCRPIVCPLCGHVTRCSECGNESHYYADKPDENEHIKYWFTPIPEHMRVIELSRWDGSDVCTSYSLVVTGRVADVLIELGLDPLCVVPMRCHAIEPIDTSSFQHQLSAREWEVPNGVLALTRRP